MLINQDFFCNFFVLTLVLPDTITDHIFCFAKGFCSLHIHYVKCYCSRVQQTAYKTKCWFNVLIPTAFTVSFFLLSKRVLKMFFLNYLLHIVYITSLNINKNKYNVVKYKSSFWRTESAKVQILAAITRTEICGHSNGGLQAKIPWLPHGVWPSETQGGRMGFGG